MNPNALLILASGTDIAQWGATRASQDRLPEVIRRLVYATTEAPSYVDFPSGDAVQLDGWDGAIELDENHPVIPRGLSVWEIGTSNSPKTKADDDYEKRSASAPDTARGSVVPPETSFVFITPRRWRLKEKWSNARRAEKIWRDVRALDADDLESWLQQAPATHVWFSRLIGLLPAGADDLETTWTDWADATTPSTLPALVLAGRTSEAAKLTSWLATGRGTFAVVAESSSDALAFIGASVLSLPEQERTPILARTAVVSNADAFAQLAASSESLILIAAYAAGNEVQRATRGGHRVILPTGPVPGIEISSTHVLVPRVIRQNAETALREMGLTESRARELAGVARRSMLTLRRRLATNPTLQTPRWADPTVGPSFIPILFAGQFNESRDADLQALGALSPAGLGALRATLTRWAQETDPPVRHTGNVWYLVSKEDAWAALSCFVSADDLTRFTAVANDVLGEVHPKFELPPEQRWAASIHGKERKYSGVLVAGVADSIALLGSLGDSVTLQGGVSPSTAAEHIVEEVFAHVAGDWRGWATLSPVLPLLAEAAPDVFLRAVNAQIVRDESAVRELFQDSGDALFTSFAHTGLLWALETLAWSPDHLAYTTRLLASLDRLDPGGRVANRPGNSLRSIFLAWLPQTSASLDTRLSVLDQLRAREPDAAWRLFSSLLPQFHDHSVYNPRPKWRDWISDRAGTGATYGEIFRQTSQIIAWMIEDAGDNPERWKTLIEALDNIGPNDFDAVITGLRQLLDRVADEAFRALIFDALREMLSKHRSFPDAQWSLPPERLAQIETLMLAATPADTFLRVRWLFSDRPQLPEGREQDFYEHSALVFERQKEAMRELHETLGTDGIVALAARIDRPDELGRVFAAVGLLTGEDEDALLSRLFNASDGPTMAMARGYAHGWTLHIGTQTAIARVRDERAWPDVTRGHLLLSQEPTESTLDVVDSLIAEGQAAFWSGVHPFWFKDAAVERGLRGVLEHGRPHAFVDAAAVHIRQQPHLDAELLVAGLEKVLQSRSDANGKRADAHDVSALLDALERAVQDGRFEEARLARLEFLYLPVLGHSDRPPRTLHSAMAREPNLFVDAVKIAYTNSVESEAADKDRDPQLVERAYHLLHSWRMPLGTSPQAIDEAAMNAWVDQVRESLKSDGRLTIGDHLIGQVLSSPVPDSDGMWPRIAIRNLVERLESDDFESGLRIGKYNSRGVISRNPLGGGDLERGEASVYEKMATTMATTWPRTAALLRLMARSAHADATREDIESELREDLND